MKGLDMSANPFPLLTPLFILIEKTPMPKRKLSKKDHNRL